MSDPLLARIEAAARAAGLRIGFVASINTAAGTANITLAGGTVAALAWASTYTPTVGDRVILAKADGEWIILAKHSRVLTGGGVAYGEATLTPQWYAGDQRTVDGFPDDWFWQASQQAPQGKGVLGPSDFYVRAAVGIYPTPASVLPAGATVLAAKLRLGLAINEPVLRTPRVYTHNRTTAQTSGPPVWTTVAGVPGPWSPGTVLGGQSAQWDLPSAWLTAWLAGTIRGLGLASTAAEDLATFTSGVVTISYSYVP